MVDVSIGWRPDIVIHHFPCDDGFGAAWICNKRWPDGIEYRGTNYGQEPPIHDIDDKRVLIVDFSFPSGILMDMSEVAHSVVILDHHKTAKAMLEPIPALYSPSQIEVTDLMKCGYGNLFAHFDMNRSGAGLTWEFCFPGREAPDMVRMIEDRDLWRFSFEWTREFSTYLRSYKMTFADWDAINEDLSAHPGRIREEARAIQRFFDRKVAEICETAVWVNIDGQQVPFVFAPPVFASDCANHLLQLYFRAPFAAAGNCVGTSLTVSLRGEDARVDVEEIARKFGGGGHRNAAGFRIPDAMDVVDLLGGERS